MAKYAVIIQNCFEDFLCEIQPVVFFDTLEQAKANLSCIGHGRVFDVNGELRWYFQSCSSEGILKDLGIEDDYLECYQLIDIVLTKDDTEIILTDKCLHHPKAIDSYCYRYEINYLGEVKWN